MYSFTAHLLQYGPYHDQMTGPWVGWGGILGMIVFALLLAAVVLAVVRLVFLPVLGATESTARLTSADSAREVLRERFARGEIDEEEYERRLTVLAREDA